ncbi:MAG: hypothetical protein IPM32_15355 [Ignavibacteriae bacterium]|nr:hypothetical protein [Ignavibacteriota bacterium]
MKNIIKTLSLTIVFALLLINCEHPSEFKRDNNFDRLGINFGIEIKGPKQNEIVDGNFSIKIVPKDSSTQFNLKIMDVFIDDSLVASSSKIPFTIETNTNRIKYGFHILKCKIYTKDSREDEEFVQFFHGPFEQLKEILVENNSISIGWDFGIKFSKYIINSSLNKEMMNSDHVVTITDPFMDNYTVVLDQSLNILYYQIIAINENGDSVKSNIQGIERILLNTAHINDGFSAVGVAVNNSGTIFLATGRNGLFAYNYSDSMLIKTAEKYLGGYVSRVLVSKENTLFLLLNVGEGGDEGLNAYNYNGYSFSKIAHTKNGVNGLDLIEGPNGIIYIANYCEGLRAYSFNGLDFTFKAQLEVIEGCANGITLSSNGTVILANSYNGIKAYSFDGTRFTKTAQVEGYANDIVIDNEGRIIVAGGIAGLNIYSFDGMSFSNIDMIDNGGTANRLSISKDGTIFLANGNDGLRAYFISNSKIFNTAYTNTNGNAQDVAIGNDGTIFLANGEDGLRVYEYKWITL